MPQDIFAKPIAKMFDSAEVMASQRVRQYTHGETRKNGSLLTDIKDESLKFGNCHFVEWLLKIINSTL